MISTSLTQITTREDLLKAADHLRNHLPRSIKLLNTLLVTAHSQTDTGRIFYIDHDTTEEEAFVILIDPWNEKQKREEISLFCSPNLNRKMRKYLSDLLDWSKNIMFWGVDELQIDLVRSLCHEKGNLDFEEPCWIFSVWPNISLPANEKIDGLMVRPVAPKHSGSINSFWKFREEGTEDMIRRLCEEGKVFGAFYEENDHPVAWMFEYVFGALGNLFTRVEFRRRSFASKVVEALTEDATSRGLHPYVHIEESNAASMALFVNLGFTKHTKAYWLGFSSEHFKK